MKRKIIVISLFCIVLCSLYYVFHTNNVLRTGLVSGSPTEDSVFQQDTIFSFLVKTIVTNDKIYDQISAIASQDRMLSFSDSIIQIEDVRWRVNLKSDNIVLMTSVQPDDPKMKQVVKYLTGIYGKPYEDEEDGYDIKWSSSDNPSDIFRPGSTLVHLRRVRSEEGGTFLFFK